MITLTTREHEVFTGFCTGQTDKQIAEKLNISARTVQTYGTRIRLKVNATDKAHAVYKILMRGFEVKGTTIRNQLKETP